MKQWRFLTKVIGIGIVVLDMPLLNNSSENDLMQTFSADIVLQALSFTAENERNSLHQRQAEGIAAAKARGVPLGRRAKPLPKNFDRVFQRGQWELIPTFKSVQECGMPLSAFRYRAKTYEAADRF